MNVYWFSFLFSVGFIVVVLDLVRRRKLKEQYSLLWLLVGLGLLVTSSNTVVLEWMAALLSIQYAPAVLFLLGIIFCFVLILHLTVVTSRLSDRVLRLAQEVALLKAELAQRGRTASPESAEGSVPSGGGAQRLCGPEVPASEGKEGRR